MRSKINAQLQEDFPNIEKWTRCYNPNGKI